MGVLDNYQKSLYSTGETIKYTQSARGDLRIDPKTLVPALMNQFTVIPDSQQEPSLSYAYPGYIDAGYVDNTF